MVILRWYIDGNISRAKVQVGGTHTATTDLRPLEVCITAREAGKLTEPTVLDINDDGTTIFGTGPKAALPANMTDHKWTTLPGNVIRKGSIVTLDIDQVADETPCRDLTVELVCEEE